MATLAADCAANATTVTVAGADDLPAGPQFLMDIGGERVRVMEIDGASFRILRAAPVAHPAGTDVSYVDPAETPAAAMVRERLSDYLANPSPTAAESVTAIKDLIRAVRYLSRP